MIKTQVQIPDVLHREAKRVASDYEMSFAEVVRRGLESIVEQYPPRLTKGKWQLPEPENMGCRSWDDVELKRLAQEENPSL